MAQYETDNLSNWKNNRRSNQLNAIWLLIFYVLFCALIGFSVDVIHGMLMENRDLRSALKALVLSDQSFYVMDTMIILSILTAIFFYVYHDKILRVGLNTRKLSIHPLNNKRENLLVEEFCQMSQMIGLKHPPSLWVAEHNFVNAFSSGCNEKAGLVVLTRGLIEQLDLAEVKAVLAVMLFRIKLRETHLTQIVSLISSGPLFLFDTLFYKTIYNKKRKENPVPIINALCFYLISIRFILPIVTLSFFSRFYLDPDRIYYAHLMAANFLGDNQSLLSALIKVRDAHFDNETLVSQEYNEIIHDGLRREAYFFDPVDFNLAQTITSSFTTQPSIEEQLTSMNHLAATVPVKK